MFSSADLSLVAAGENTHLVTGGLRYDFTQSQAVSCKHIQRRNHRLRVFEAGYWKDFQN
jgi:hypothetical protein